MSEHIIIAIIVSLPPTLAASVALFKMHKIARQIFEVHLQLNGRLDQWIQATQVAAHAEGVKEEAERCKWPGDESKERDHG